MCATRLFRWAVLSALALAAGCSLFGQSSPSPSVSNDTVAPTTAPAAGADSVSPDALAAKVNSYTHELSQQLDRPATRPIVVSDNTTQPSAERTAFWLGADPFRLTPYGQEPDRPARRVRAGFNPAPPQAPTATANANFPISVPEGADSPTDTGQAVNASATESPGLSAERLETAFARRLRDDPQDLENQLNYELLLFIEGQPVPQMSALAGLRDEDREVLAAIMDGLSNFRSVIRSGDNLLLAAKTQPLVAMGDRLRTQSELTISTVALCSIVKTFGVYTPMDAAHFIAGRDNQTVVYCEVQNFQSRLTADSQWQTQLTEKLVLYTESGLPVWPDPSVPEPVTDLCRQKRHDFFIARLVTLPRNLSVGRYVLKLTVTDQSAHRVAEASQPITIVAE
jgi:hypothetical protein